MVVGKSPKNLGRWQKRQKRLEKTDLLTPYKLPLLSNSNNKKQLIFLSVIWKMMAKQSLLVMVMQTRLLLSMLCKLLDKKEMSMLLLMTQTYLFCYTHHWHSDMGDIFVQLARCKGEGPKVFNIWNIVEKSLTHRMLKQFVYSRMGWL